MAVIAWCMEDDRGTAAAHGARLGFIEWRVVALSAPLFLYSYSYGTVSSFSAVFAGRAAGSIRKRYDPTAFAVTTLFTRPFLGRFGDRIGYRRIFLPSRVAMTLGMIALTFSDTRLGLACSGLTFALGFGTAYPAFAAYVDAGRRPRAPRRGVRRHPGGVRHRHRRRVERCSGWLIGRFGFQAAFGLAAALSALALPAFLFSERRFGHHTDTAPPLAEARGPELAPLVED